VAIIGAGAGGAAAAYSLADRLDVDLFEARSKIGGHCDSHVIEHAGGAAKRSNDYEPENGPRRPL
jgi:predicted NAD/FAD-binding protein